MFNELPFGSHVDLVIETNEIREAVKMCAGIIVQGWDKTGYCQLETWQQLMETWKRRGSTMIIREFNDDGDDADCACCRLAASPEAWQADKDALEEQEHPTVFWD
jgi:hypothetical protein